MTDAFGGDLIRDPQAGERTGSECYDDYVPESHSTVADC
jgi:hypothetical protein